MNAKNLQDLKPVPPMAEGDAPLRHLDGTLSRRRSVGSTVHGSGLHRGRRQRALWAGDDSLRPGQFQRKEAVVSLLAWIILGLISGFLASKIVNKTGEGLLLDIVLGIIGAVVGGWLFNQFGHMGVTGLNLYSILVSVAGAIVVLVVYHAIRRG
jgi:uncharacterized membrane protein YeaQ/YmgE (transglycosylase-associated protein family)